MAMKCSVCDEKIGSFAKYNVWIPDRDDLPICLSCTEKIKEAKRTNINPENRMSLKMQRDALEFLSRCTQREAMEEVVRNELESQLPSLDEVRARQEESKPEGRFREKNYGGEKQLSHHDRILISRLPQS